jgi:hypothetical protein
MGASKSKEAQPIQSKINVTEETVFLAKDGIALSTFGSTVHKLLIQNSFSKQIESLNGHREEIIGSTRIEEVRAEIAGICSDLGIDPSPENLDNIGNEFKGIVNRRMPKLNGFFKLKNRAK